MEEKGQTIDCKSHEICNWWAGGELFPSANTLFVHLFVSTPPPLWHGEPRGGGGRAMDEEVNKEPLSTYSGFNFLLNLEWFQGLGEHRAGVEGGED